MSPATSASDGSAGPRLPDALRGILWMLLAVVCLSAVMVSVRALKSADVSTVQILFLRAVVGLVVLMPLVLRHRGAAMRSTRRGYHLIRNALHLTAQGCLFVAIIHVPLGEVTAFEFTVPLLASVAASFWIREKVLWHRWVGMVVGLFGVLFIVRPGFDNVHPTVFVALAGCLCFAANNVMIKVLTRTDSALTIVFHLGLFQTLLSLPLALFAWSPLGWAELPWILVLGIAGMAAHYGISRALGLADISLVFPFDFLRMPLTAAAAWVVWGEVMSPYTWLGAAIIFGSSYWVTRRETRASRRRGSEAK